MELNKNYQVKTAWAMSNGHDNAEKINHLRRWKAKEGGS